MEDSLLGFIRGIECASAAFHAGGIDMVERLAGVYQVGTDSWHAGWLAYLAAWNRLVEHDDDDATRTP